MDAAAHVPRRRGFTSDLRTVWQGRGFRRLYAVRLSSQTADGMFEAALGGLFFFSPERATTPTAIAVAFGVALVPYTVVGPFAGVLLDHWRRRQILLTVNLLRGVMVAGVAALVAAGAVGPPLYLVVLACLSVNRFFLAGLGAGLPHVVPGDELVMANAVSTTSGTVVALLGGGLGIGLRTALGAGDRTDAAVLLLAATGYVGSALSARRLAPDALGPDALGPDALGPDSPDGARPTAVGERWRDVWGAVRGVGAGLVEAARYLWRRPGPSHALAVIGGQRFAFGLVTVATILLCRATFADPADPAAGALRLAVAFAVSGAGFFTAAVLTPWVTARIARESWMVACCLAAAGLAGGYAVSLTGPGSYPLLLVCGGALGVAMQGTKLCVDAIVQGGVDDAYRGRAMSFYDMTFNIAFALAAAACALVLPADGRSPLVFATVALIYAVTGVGYGLARRSR